MNPLSAAILTSVADDCKNHWDAGRFGRAPTISAPLLERKARCRVRDLDQSSKGVAKP